MSSYGVNRPSAATVRFDYFSQRGFEDNFRVADHPARTSLSAIDVRDADDAGVCWFDKRSRDFHSLFILNAAVGWLSRAHFSHNHGRYRFSAGILARASIVICL